MTEPADRRQREAALDPGRSFIVQAPAGSGKTELLIRRVLTLLARVDEPEEIVAITFTRKAAGEMRERVLQALAGAEDGFGEEAGDAGAGERTALARGALARDRERGWRLLEHPARLRIQTIDSLCLSLVRAMPWTSRLGGPPAVVEEAESLYREAARDTVALIEAGRGPWSASIEALLDHLDNRPAGLEDLLVGMLARREQWLRLLAGRAGDPAAQREVLERAWRLRIADELERTAAAVPAELAPDLVALARHAADNLDDGSPIAAARDLAGLPAAEGGALPAWRALAALLLTGGGTWRARVDRRQGFPPENAQTKGRMNALLERLRGDEALRERLAAVPELPAVPLRERQWRALAALLEILPVAAGQLELRFQERGACDFSEIMQRAVAALGDEQAPTDLALVLDYRIRHLLVDEFQDTSYMQVRLLRRLTAGWEPGDGRTLFLVGDPMQSIYRFREAEVGLFLEAWERGLGDLPLQALRLSANFRSVPALVSWGNEALAGAFAPEADEVRGAVPFSPATAAVTDAGGGTVVHPLIDGGAADEAALVARLVQEELAADPAARIAVLARARTHLAWILPALRDSGVRYMALDLDSLWDRPVVRDLFSLTRALLQPADSAAWLAVLRAPWCGLQLGDLLAVAPSRDGPGWPVCLRDPERLARLGPEAGTRLQAVAATLAQAHAARGRRALRDLVESAWIRLGGPACTDPAGLVEAQAFLDCLAGSERAAEVEDTGLLAESVARLRAPPDPGADDRVQVMTVHRAKGLEFDVVILPGLQRPPRTDSPSLLLWHEWPREPGGSELLLAPLGETGGDRDPAHRYLQQLKSVQTDLEAGRLLYVACTRARRRLHLPVTVARADDGGLTPPPRRSLLARLWPAIEAELAAASPVPGRAFDASLPAPRRLRRLPAAWHLPAPPPTAAGSRYRALAPAESPLEPEYWWAGETARHVGTVVHAVLRRMAVEGLPRWNPDRVRAAARGWRALLAAEGVPRGALDEATSLVAQALVNVLEDPRGRWLLDPAHGDAASELAITGDAGDGVAAMVLDRTFVDGEGTRWIVDFKTSRHEGGDPAAFLDREQERHAPQLERYGRLMSQLEERPLRLALYFPLLKGWREWPAP